jgi:predicted amidohydrolase
MSAPATPSLRVACVQLNTRDDKAANIAAAAGFIERAAAAGARLVVLPETWSFKGSSRGILEAGEELDGPSTTRMRELAELHGVYLLAGSFYELTGRPGRLFNTSVLFGPHGERLAVYRKIHLFDAVSDTVAYRESDALDAGDAIVLADIDGVPVGLSICYDLRFPELYAQLALRGARIFLVPAAFTAYTGAAHWHVLLRARAVENGCFVIAPNQVGFHTSTNECYGHSMVVDPWGRVLAEIEDGTGTCLADLDLARVDEVRAALPSLRHRRPDVYQSS